MQRTCKQCGKTFALSQSEIDFYQDKNLSIPKRCEECRAKHKQVNHGSGGPTYTPSGTDSNYRKAKGYEKRKVILGVRSLVF